METNNSPEKNRSQELNKVNLLDENCEPTEEQFQLLFEAMLEDVNERATKAREQQKMRHQAAISKAIAELQESNKMNGQ